MRTLPKTVSKQVPKPRALRPLLSLFILISTASWADHPDHESVASGVATVSPGAIEKTVRQLIAHHLNATVLGSKIEFTTSPIKENIKIPQDNLVTREILGALGIQSFIDARIDPIQVKLQLPQSGLDLKIRQSKPELFDVVAKWKITQLSASSPRLNIRVPRGLFDQNFDLDAQPVQIKLKSGSPAIEVTLKAQLQLQQDGTRVRLVSLVTNLNEPNPDRHPNLDFQIGPLLINRQPLKLQLESNQIILEADEKSIREQLEAMEADFTLTLRNQIEVEVQKAFQTLAETMASSPKLSVKLSTDAIVNRPGIAAPIQKLLKGIEADFVFNSLEYVPSMNLFSASIHSHVCLDKQCLFSLQPSPVGHSDLQTLAHSHQAGMLIHESWLQRVMNDSLFQDRIRDYYNTQAKAPGVDIAPAGVKLHLNPRDQSIDAVFSLSIDIKKTELSKESNTAWKRFIDRSKKRIGDTWEYFFGTGKRVIIPVQVSFRFAGFTPVRSGKRELLIESKLPFLPDGKIINTYGYPSNIDQLTGLVRKDFMEAIEKTFKDVVPATLKVPVPSPFQAGGVSIDLKSILITPNRGLLVTAEVVDAPLASSKARTFLNKTSLNRGANR